MRVSEILRTLRAIDWDFAAPRPGYVPPPHWYPGTFVPALSDALVESLVPLSGTVFDPYAGIGTTGWSATRLGRKAYIADINPIAILVSYVTNALLLLSMREQNLGRLSLDLLDRLTKMDADLFGTRGFERDAQLVDETAARVCWPSPISIIGEIVAAPPNWRALEHWIAEETMVSLKIVLNNINKCRFSYIRLLGLCMISATIRSLSSQHASWGHIADNVLPRQLKAQDVRTAMTRWLARSRGFIGQAKIASSPGRMTDPPSKIYLRDWSKPMPIGPQDADLLLTSPPYADAIDYTLAQRLSLYLLGYDDDAILRLVSGEIGARRKRFKALSRADWSHQLCDGLRDQLSWLKPDSVVCLILPHKDSGRSAGGDRLKATLEQLGWHLFFERDRSIHQSHTRQSWTSIKKESILAFASKSFYERKKDY